ncbi:hypothetical protein [Mesorhizobium sp. NBSH29]|uniref:hypothetical protein n=1 Tax=Mesorhizobium sp. NBSH29 TaxID=2654249 RepID=UPI00215625F6|nr:hypothetical protein [Mesorhizobium sp. NBSH29]
MQKRADNAARLHGVISAGKEIRARSGNWHPDAVDDRLQAAVAGLVAEHAVGGFPVGAHAADAGDADDNRAGSQ